MSAFPHCNGSKCCHIRRTSRSSDVRYHCEQWTMSCTHRTTGLTRFRLFPLAVSIQHRKISFSPTYTRRRSQAAVQSLRLLDIPTQFTLQESGMPAQGLPLSSYDIQGFVQPILGWFTRRVQLFVCDLSGGRVYTCGDQFGLARGDNQRGCEGAECSFCVDYTVVRCFVGAGVCRLR